MNVAIFHIEVEGGQTTELKAIRSAYQSLIRLPRQAYALLNLHTLYWFRWARQESRVLGILHFRAV